MPSYPPRNVAMVDPGTIAPLEPQLQGHGESCADPATGKEPANVRAMGNGGPPLLTPPPPFSGKECTADALETTATPEAIPTRGQEAWGMRRRGAAA